MTSVQLLTLAGVITKDPNHVEYTSAVKYSMLSSAQEAIMSVIDVEHLNSAKKAKVHTPVASPGTFTLETDFLRHVYFERDSDKREIEFVDLENKGKLASTVEGGTDLRPSWVYYNIAGVLTGKLLLATFPTGVLTQFYVPKPPTLSDSQNPIITGFDAQIVMYFKYMFHLIEGQDGLANIAFQSFLASLQPYVKNKQLILGKLDKKDG